MHSEFRGRLKPRDLGACWNTLGKLLRRSRDERQWLKDHPGAMDVLLEQTRETLPQFDAQAVANTVHGLSAINVACGWTAGAAAWAELASRAAAVTESGNSQSLTNTAYAFAKLGYAAPELLEAIAAAAVPRLNEFIPQGLANTAWAFAKLQHDAPALFDTIGDAAISRLDDFEDQGLSTTAWAFATAGHRHQRFFEAVGEHINARGRIDSFRPQHLANLAWAFAMADVRCDALFRGPEFADACRWMEARLIGDNRSLVQLNRWQLWRDECCEAGHSWPALPGPLRAACAEQAKWFGAHKAKLDAATPRAISTPSRGAISTPPPGDRSSKT